MKTGLYTRHWLRGSNGRIWYHKSNQRMQVEIQTTSRFDRDYPRGKYRIMHTHPTKSGHVIVQPYEYADNMVKARKLALAHLKNWNNPLRWFKHH